MLKIDLLDDTIVAISTATGQGGIGIVRLSGKEAVAIADKMFLAKSGKPLAEAKTFTLHYGNIVKGDTKEIVDEALVAVMRAPKSYTKEDVVEINSHGGIVSLKAILNLAIDLGARLAEPGEFTKRAFLNGRIDLAQAEAVLDIIQAKTDSFLKVSTSQLKGELSKELESIRDVLMQIYVELEADINFPEDEIDPKEREKIIKDISGVLKKVENLLCSSEQGKILKEGIKIVICGKPNVGKSSLLNVLLKTPRAIISEIEGTTRDTIEETAQIRGIPFQVVDTAGILVPRNLIEEEAVKRSHMSIASADMVLLLLDASQELSQEDKDFIEEVQHKNKIIVLNKSDLKRRIDTKDIRNFSSGSEVIQISALQQTGIDLLEELVVEKVWQGKVVASDGILISNVRHIQSLKNCKQSLMNVYTQFDENIPLEFISEDIKAAVNHLDRITGKDVDADLLNIIFSQFCVGK